MDETASDKIKKIKFIHFAICVGVILAYALVGQFTMEQLKGQEIDSNELVYLAIPVAAFFLSNLMFKTLLGKLDSNAGSDEKFQVYLTASLIRWAILEGAAFIILFVAPDLVILGIIVIVYLMYLRPTEQKIAGIL